MKITLVLRRSDLKVRQNIPAHLRLTRVMAQPKAYSRRSFNLRKFIADGG